MNVSILILLGLVLVAAGGVWVVLSGGFRTGRGGGGEGRWADGGRVGSLASPPLLLLSAIVTVGAVILLTGVLLSRM